MSQNMMEPTEHEAETEDEVAQIDELILRIPEMDEQLTDLRGAVEGLLAELANYPAGGPWLWDALEPAAQRDLWIELDAFVVWLQNRILRHHADRTRWITPCWYRHPDVVEQLTALMVAHKASYHPKAQTPSHTLVDWFQKCLWPTMDSLKDRLTLKRCQSERKHVEASISGVELVENDSAFAAFVDETVPESETDDDGVDASLSVDPTTGEVIESPHEEELPDPGEGVTGRNG